jgi:bacterioferritin-associated ferredoxin
VIKAEIPYKACIFLSEGSVSFSGPVDLEIKMNHQKQHYGENPAQWKTCLAKDGYDVLLNEFILKCQNNYKIPYNHTELCHCRMIPTEKVVCAIKQGAFSVSEVSRQTIAGTGCGSCKKDIEELINYLVK